MSIELDYRKNPDLFDTVAKEWADKIADTKGKKTKKTQVRNFYDYVLDLYEKSEHEEFEEILPFVRMLNSKVSYAVERKVANREFKEMIEKCVQEVNEKEDLRRFKLFFEAVIGFYKEKK